MNPAVGYYAIFFVSLPFILTVTLAPMWHAMIARILPSGVNNQDHFDFIVVGSGSAGSVVAGRLAEAGHEVLLVEAGGPPNWMMSIPALMASAQFTSYDWQYKTVPQKHTLQALKERKSNWPRGKVLGGSSQLNSMAYVRGNAKDFDEWAALGNRGWSYKDVLPFFTKSEDFYGSKDSIDLEYHGKGGLMGVRTIPDVSDLSIAFEDGLGEMGISSGDYNGKEQNVHFRMQANQNSGWRADSYSTFAKPFVGKGLTVLTHAQATQVLFKDNSKEVVGVKVTRFDQEMNLFAKKEVVLSAGSIGSPHILMLSGIGPKQQLDKVGINTLVNLPGMITVFIQVI